MQRLTELRVWQQAHQLTLAVYGATKTFPRAEQFGVSSQLQRACASVPANIAEGSKRRSNSDYARFLNMAESSLAETEYHLILARDLKYLPVDRATTMMDECNDLAKRIAALREKVERSGNVPKPSTVDRQPSTTT